MPGPLPDLEPVIPEAGRPLVVVPIGSADGPTGVVITGEDWLDAICPFLRAGDGSWRSNSPARDHRCWATAPPSELPVLTQQRVCLVRRHDDCERFTHARELRAASLTRSAMRPTADLASASGQAAQGGASRALGVGAVIRPGRRRRLVAAAAVVAGMAGLVFLLAAGIGPAERRPGSSLPVVAASGAPGSARPTGDPSLVPDDVRRYRVREGDTLRTIADRFGISVRQLRAANDLGDPPRLAPGDVLRIPPA